jgi:hypothetical protein
MTNEELAERYSAFVEKHDEVTIVNGLANSLLRLSILFDGLVFSTSAGPFEIELRNHKKILNNTDLSKINSMISIDLGDNLKGGETIPPIIKGLLSVARRIGDDLGAIAVYWRPANIISDFPYFSGAVASYESHGFFPVLSLIDLFDNDNNTIVSHGLAFLSTQEVHFSYDGLVAAEAMRLMLTIVQEIASEGPIVDSDRLQGLERGNGIDLKISPTGQQVFAQAIFESEQ